MILRESETVGFRCLLEANKQIVKMKASETQAGSETALLLFAVFILLNITVLEMEHGDPRLHFCSYNMILNAVHLVPPAGGML